MEDDAIVHVYIHPSATKGKKQGGKSTPPDFTEPLELAVGAG